MERRRLESEVEELTTQIMQLQQALGGEAARWQQQFVDLLNSENVAAADRAKSLPDSESRLDLYHARQPFRDELPMAAAAV